MPSACILAMFSFAGFEKPHSSMLQLATVSTQPHLQARWAPTRRASILGFSEAVWAQDNAPTSATMTSHQLLLNRRMLPCHSYHFRAGVLHLYLARNETGEGAANQNESANPDPRNQRKDICLNHRALVVIG